MVMSRLSRAYCDTEPPGMVGPVAVDGEEGMCALTSHCTTVRSTSINTGSIPAADVSGGGDVKSVVSDMGGGSSEASV